MSTKKHSQAIYSSVDDLAQELGISRQKAYTELRAGTIPSIRLGRRFVIPRSAVADWLRRAGGSTPIHVDVN